jgi:hypothetical protein
LFFPSATASGTITTTTDESNVGSIGEAIDHEAKAEEDAPRKRKRAREGPIRGSCSALP